jgi:hypothetical protein
MYMLYDNCPGVYCTIVLDRFRCKNASHPVIPQETYEMPDLVSFGPNRRKHVLSQNEILTKRYPGVFLKKYMLSHLGY